MFLDDYELPLLRTSKDWVRLKERLYLLESYLAPAAEGHVCVP
jgi:hypothetical protein